MVGYVEGHGWGVFGVLCGCWGFGEVGLVYVMKEAPFDGMGLLFIFTNSELYFNNFSKKTNFL
ncbi:hypothetical protein FUA71_05780 [Listeria innocua]|nr:hypothetical protein [Listeria innocua]ECX4531221.1 hypothetical protein [Listeria innocua]ECX5123746.1 hypothetical protein [Listeria innocua]